MKSKSLLYGTTITAAILLTLFGLKAAADTDASASTDKRWQHLALETEPEKATADPELSAKIVQLGQDGWELVTVLNFASEGTTSRTVYYFKKPQV